MAVIEITCPDCATTSTLPARALLAAVDLTDTRTPLGELSWVCDTCGHLTIAEVEWTHLLHLISTGVPLLDTAVDDAALGGGVDVQASERVPHPEDPAAGAPFTAEDLLTLHEQLETDTWWQQLAQPPGHRS